MISVNVCADNPPSIKVVKSVYSHRDPIFTLEVEADELKTTVHFPCAQSAKVFAEQHNIEMQVNE